jgi:hypothetical protein
VCAVSSLGAVRKVWRDVMMSERRHLIVVAPPPTDDEHRVARGFDPPKRTAWRGCATSIHHGDPNISTVLSLAEEHDRQKDKYRYPVITVGLALVFAVALMAAGVWPAINIHGFSLHQPLSGPP